MTTQTASRRLSAAFVLAFAAAAISCGSFPTFASAATYVTQWGSAGTGDGQLSGPRGVAVDATGNVYVAESGNNRIQKFTSVGAYVTKWGSTGTGNGQFGNPTGVAVDSSGCVYVADYSNERIQKFTSAGTFVAKWGGSGHGDGQFSLPTGVAVDSSGYVYVADLGNNRIQKFTSVGAYVTKWGSTGTGDGQFNGPRSVAVDSSGYILVTETGNNRVQKFTSTGTFVAKWGSLGTGDGQFDFPTGVAADSSGDVYVADWSNHRVQKFTSAGVFVTKWGSTGTGDGQFNFPMCVAVDSSDDVYVSDYVNNRIQKFRVDSVFALSYAAGANGTLSGDVAQVVVHRASGTTVTAVPDPGYRFSSWSDGASTAARRDVDVTASIAATASFHLNRAPMASSISTSVGESVATTITLPATDADGDPLTYSIGTGASNGSLGPVAGNTVGYTPTTGYLGADSFAFRTNDGLTDSNVATVSITVDPVPVTFIDPGLDATVRVALGIPQPLPVSSEDMHRLTTLDSANLEVTDIEGLRYAAELVDVDLSSNRLTDISPLARLPRLATLRVNNNSITVIPANLPSGLRVLEAKDNRLAALPDDLPADLEDIDVSGNDIAELKSATLASIPGARNISAERNRIPAIPANLPPALERLRVSNNRITAIPALPASTKELYASVNSITVIPANLPSGLRVLEAKDNRLAALPMLPVQLKTLRVSRNQIAELRSHAPSNDPSAGTIARMLPTADSPLPAGLEELDISENLITELPDDLPSTLATVNASFNRLTALPAMLPSALPVLAWFDVRYNQLDIADGSAPRTVIDSLLARGAVVLFSPQDAVPVASNQSVATPSGTPVRIMLSATDDGGTPLTYDVVSNPIHGSLTPLEGSTTTYTPNPGYAGTDSFTFTASDAFAESDAATVSITIAGAPVVSTPASSGWSLAFGIGVAIVGVFLSRRREKVRA